MAEVTYGSLALRLYDTVAFRIDAPFFWRCSVKDLLGAYDAHVSARHLDVGVGSGYLLDRCRFPAARPEITLMDVNPGPLAFSAKRLRRYGPSTHRADMLEPWQLPPSSFDSIALSNVLSCASGTLREKAVAFEHARDCLAPGGRLFGATVLNGGVKHTRRSRFALRMLNRRGVFDNLDDDLDALERGLIDVFGACEVEVRGCAALFVAEREEQDD